MAGVPDFIIKRAKKVLNELENGSKIIYKELPDQMTLTQSEDSIISKEVLEKLKKIDPTTLTPIESMNILFNLVSEVNKKL